jgi:hypothetical protein
VNFNFPDSELLLSPVSITCKIMVSLGAVTFESSGTKFKISVGIHLFLYISLSSTVMLVNFCFIFSLSHGKF